MNRPRWMLVLLVVAALAWTGAGCASPQAESDLPWNMSQPWESAPGVPFGSTGSY